jgi:hypothetical protein
MRENPPMRRTAFVALVCFLNGCALIARRGTIAYLAVTAQTTDMKLQINKAFMERYRNRVTIQTTVTVDRAMESPFPAFLDGALHLAGRAPQIGLPTVGEIVNAASQKDAVDIVHRAEGTRKPLKVSGVWRVWPEHAAIKMEKQGTPLPPFESRNPEHVFEIHPVTRINDTDLLDSFRPVEGFKPGGRSEPLGSMKEPPAGSRSNQRRFRYSRRQGSTTMSSLSWSSPMTDSGWWPTGGL